MSDTILQNLSRRGFLERTLAAAGAAPLVPALLLPCVHTVHADAAEAGRTSGYRALDADEAAFTESMVRTLCPADHLSPDGVTCGLARLVDRQFGEGAGTPLEAAQERFFKAGLRAADAECRERHGVRFDQLAPERAREFIRDVAAGRVEGEFPLTAWFTEIVGPLLTRACFAGSVYDLYGSRVYWKVFGYSGGSTASST
jgi:gluconate 2-dehydrogenase gamma chain